MSKTKIKTLLFDLALAAALVWTPACERGENVDRAAVLDVMRDIGGETLIGYVQELASDRYAGRLTGSPEYTACARWMADRLAGWGIKPAGDDGSYLQAFPCPYTDVQNSGELTIKNGEQEKTYAYEQDYYPGSNSASGRVTAEVVYVGYGITAPELGYDDYAGVDVEGKIILLEREVPLSPEDDPETFLKWRPYSFHQYKLQNAYDHGVRGILYNYLTTNTNTPYIEGLLFSQISGDVTVDILDRTGRSTEELKTEIQETLKPRSFATGKIATIANQTRHHPQGIGYNVIGVLEGTDALLKEEVILIGGHLDHVGRCHEIMPGANDNASGIAVILGVAEALAKSPLKPRRSVAFMGIGAEELGLIGARYYLDHPVFPLEKTAAFINLDSVGRGDVLIALSGDNFPAFRDYILGANRDQVGRAVETPYFANLGRPRNDSCEFLWKGVPSISFGSRGGPPGLGHSTRDTADTIDPGILQDLARILYIAVLDMANQDALDFRTGG